MNNYYNLTILFNYDEEKYRQEVPKLFHDITMIKMDCMKIQNHRNSTLNGICKI